MDSDGIDEEAESKDAEIVRVTHDGSPCSDYLEKWMGEVSSKS